MTNKEDIQINYSKLNNTADCLICCTPKGFIIYNINPFRILLNKKISGGFNFGFLYNRSNIIFLVGTGVNTNFPTNRLIIWDEYLRKTIAEISISDKIDGIKILNNYICVYSKSKCYIYDLETLSHKQSINLVSYAMDCYLSNDDFLFAFPNLNYKNIGYVNIKTNKKLLEFTAHQYVIHKIAVSHNGKFIATCSNEGRIIKLFTNRGNLVREYTRGYYIKNISYLGFSECDNWIICSSDYSTIHLFNLRSNNEYTFGRRERATCNFVHNDIIHNCYFNTETRTIIFNSSQKIYIGQIIDNQIKITQTYLLVIEKDPFSLSPKISR